MRPARRPGTPWMNPSPRHPRGLSAVCSILVLVCTACAGGARGEAAAEDLTPDANGVITTRSGLKYKVLTQGVGPKPTARDRVLVHYFCALTDGTVIDSSYDRGQPDVLALRDLIRGFRDTLQMMAVGSHFRVAVPAHLAYGREGREGLVGPDQPLIFEIQLYSIVERRAGGFRHRRRHSSRPRIRGRRGCGRPSHL